MEEQFSVDDLIAELKANEAAKDQYEILGMVAHELHGVPSAILHQYSMLFPGKKLGLCCISCM